MRSAIVRCAGAAFSGLAIFLLSVVVALAVEHGMARFVWHDAASDERFVLTLVGLLYLDCRSRMVERA